MFAFGRGVTRRLISQLVCAPVPCSFNPYAHIHSSSVLLKGSAKAAKKIATMLKTQAAEKNRKEAEKGATSKEDPKAGGKKGKR